MGMDVLVSVGCVFTEGLVSSDSQKAGMISVDRYRITSIGEDANLRCKSTNRLIRSDLYLYFLSPFDQSRSKHWAANRLSFELTEVTLRDNDVGFALFQKKSEYSVAQGTVTDLTMVNSTENYLIQTGSVLSIDSILITGDLKDVEALMYGAVYGRATVR